MYQLTLCYVHVEYVHVCYWTLLGPSLRMLNVCCVYTCTHEHLHSLWHNNSTHDCINLYLQLLIRLFIKRVQFENNSHAPLYMGVVKIHLPKFTLTAHIRKDTRLSIRWLHEISLYSAFVNTHFKVPVVKYTIFHVSLN